VTPDSLKRIAESFPKIMGDQQIGPGELEVIDKDGTIVTIQFLVRPVYKDGVIDEYVGVSRVVGVRKPAG
jgi:hypothetical protein